MLPLEWSATLIGTNVVLVCKEMGYPYRTARAVLNADVVAFCHTEVLVAVVLEWATSVVQLYDNGRGKLA